MAGPISLIRKYQKVLLAVFGVLLMITFVVSSNPMGCNESGRGRGDPVVFRTRQGSMHESELASLIEARRRAHAFLVNAISVTVNNVRQDRTLASIPAEEIGRAIGEGFRTEGIDLRRDISEEAFVKSLIIARKAEELGVVISDEAISDFLRDRTLKRVTPEQFRRIHAEMKLSQNQLFQALRLELLSSRLQRMYFGINAVFGIPPGERWDYFERLNNRATAQAMALPVDSFLSQVGEPKQEQLQALYESRKNDYRIPGEPEPGFHEPEKGKFQYFKADYEKLAEKIEVTEADIQDYYEKNKGTQFRYRGFSAEPEGQDKPAAAESTDPQSAAPNSEPAANDKPAEGEAAPSTPATETPSETPPQENATPEAATTEPATTPSAPETPPASDPPSIPQGAGGDDAAGSAGQQEVPTQPAAEGAQAPEGEAQPAETSQPEPSAEPAKTDPAAAGETPPTTEPPASESAAEDQPPAAEPIVEPDDTLVLPESILSGPEPEYEPLWRVEETIRKAIRRERATAKVREVFQKLAEIVDQYGNRYTDYELSKEESENKDVGPPPTEPDFLKLAAENELTFQTTGLISPLDASETDLGKTFLNGNRPFAEESFSELRLRIPRQSVDIDGNQYLYWKIDKRDDFVPSFQEAVDAVTRAWKSEEARKLALKKAQELASDVNKSGKTLQELHGSAGTHKVIDTGEFSWMTQSSALSPEFGAGPPEVTQIPGIEDAGHDFMQTVFQLQPKQAGAALNAPQTMAYVVQLISTSPAVDMQRQQFITMPYRNYVAAGADDERRVELDWMKQLEKEADLVWIRPPNFEMR